MTKLFQHMRLGFALLGAVSAIGFQPAVAGSPPGDVVGKLTAAYQGYFSCKEPTAPDGQGWIHWAYDVSSAPSLTNYGCSSWPDMRPYSTGTYATSAPNFGNGQPAKLFTSYNSSIVSTHMQMMKQNGMDTIAIGRFNPTGISGPTQCAQLVQNAAPGAGMKYYISYDLSGWNNFSTELPNDWTNVIVNQLHMPTNANYAKQNGKPVVEVWGLGNVNPHNGTPTSELALVNWLKSQGCYVIGGVSHAWRWGTDMQPFVNVFQACNMLQPWQIGVVGDIGSVDANKSTQSDDLAWCNSHSVDYQVCILPGDISVHQRQHGNLMWEEFANLRSIGVQSGFMTMFDEFGEGNQLMPTAEDASMSPTNPSNITIPATGTNHFWTLDEDGTHCSADYYMRLTADGGKMLQGLIPLTYTRPTPPVRKLVPGAVVSFQATVNGKYVCADNSGSSPLIANRTSVGVWEQFRVVDLGNRNIALLSLSNNLYVSAGTLGTSVLTANHSSAGAGESFYECDAGGGNVALRCLANNQFVCAENAGANALIANRATYGSWETFTVRTY
ncbi:MAG: glycoside hydrolase family 71/99-like protein [Capsulimonas sp.]|uniref:glycoside hydrolase family 71/99-like protein n=1 Tax=Capsulimonas sp. TaxID=2494211 RepID=UPI0032676FEA